MSRSSWPGWSAKMSLDLFTNILNFLKNLSVDPDVLKLVKKLIKKPCE